MTGRYFYSFKNTILQYTIKFIDMKKSILLIILILCFIPAHAQTKKELLAENAELKKTIERQEAKLDSLQKLGKDISAYKESITIRVNEINAFLEGLNKKIAAFNVILPSSVNTSHIDDILGTSTPESSNKTKSTSYSPGSSSSGGTVSVRGYYRKDGTYVRPHTRSAPRRR